MELKDGVKVNNKENDLNIIKNGLIILVVQHVIEKKDRMGYTLNYYRLDSSPKVSYSNDTNFSFLENK